MNREWMGDTSRFTLQQWGRRPEGIVQSTARENQMAPNMADGSGASAITLGWAAISAAS
jgi:hypothetical protein